jgi:hypothetical protein
MRRPTVRLLFAAAILAARPSSGFGSERLPFDLAVRVAAGSDGGSASLGEDAARALVTDLSARGCFRGVRLAPDEGPADGDLILLVTLSDVREDVRYEQSLAERAQPRDEVEAALAHVAHLSFHTELKLAAIPGGAVVTASEFRVSGERRPRTPGDDAREGVRSDAILDLARRTRAAICRGSTSRLERAIEAARTAP